MKYFLLLTFMVIINSLSFSQTYPESTSSDASYEHIKLVQFAGIDNNTDADAGATGYDDFSDQIATVVAGKTYSLSVSIKSAGSEYITAWIDWNNDYDFTDAGEKYIIATDTNVSTPCIKSIIVPSVDSVADVKTVRMRVSLRWNAEPTSEGTFTYGEVEDYSIRINPDFDKDGVPDLEDLDKDNDGVLDTDENFCITQEFLNGNFESNLVNPVPNGYIQTVATNIPGWETTSGDNKIEIWYNNFNGVPAYEGTYFAEINANFYANQKLFQTLDVTPGDIVKWNVAHRGRNGVDRMDIKVGPVGNTSTVQIAETGNTGWALYNNFYTVPANVYEIEIGFEAVSTASGNLSVGNFIDDIQLYITSSTLCDSDNDGVPNVFDMDADNDGISDVVEAGGSDPDNDGMIGTGAITDTDGDGVSDIVDIDNGGTALLEIDTDKDGYINMYDIDSDGDGIVDNIEGQSTNDYIAPSGIDINKNGWDDQYDGNAGGTQIPLNDADADSKPDYIDTDSDEDGILDMLEAYAVEPTYNDSDGDGLDDSFDADKTSIIDLGGPTNGNTLSSFPNDDNPSPEKDWREPGNLPVSLISFDAVKNDNTVDLTWSTASEINNDYFLVQKSIDNVNFETIESVQGNGNSNVLINYYANDNNPNSGVNYYRLLQVDYDGTETYTNTVAVNFAGENNILIYPNPSTGIINIESASNYQIMVYTPSAELIFNKKIDNSDLYKLDLSNYSKGVYIIHLLSNNKTEVKRVIIQ